MGDRDRAQYQLGCGPGKGDKKDPLFSHPPTKGRKPLRPGIALKDTGLPWGLSSFN